MAAKDLTACTVGASAQEFIMIPSDEKRIREKIAGLVDG